MALGESNNLTIQLLGSFSVSLNGTPISTEHWKLRKVRGLVKLLALAPGHRLLRDQVIDALWPETGMESGVNAFYQALYNARRIFKHALPTSQKIEHTPLPFLELKNSFLLLTFEWNVLVDVEQFEMEASAIHACQDPKVYQSALAWYKGDLLPEDIYEDWAAGRREALRQRCLQLLRELAQLFETRNETSQAIDTFQRVLAMEYADEEAHAGLMRLYARTGQRGLALRQYQSLKEALSELDSEPDQRTLRLYEEIQTGMEVKEAPHPGRPALESLSPLLPRKHHNLPYRLSTFIGREKEIDQVLGMLRETRLLTITGTGGVGKTSMAVQAAFYLSGGVREDDSFPDGIWLVELASLNDPVLLPQAIAQMLELPGITGQVIQEALIGFLKDRRLLLILDNCEHLRDACAYLTESLLKSCPALTILTTSREPLAISGETTYRLPSLVVPDGDSLPSLNRLAQVESVQLFIDRAGKASPGFTLTQTNAEAVAQIGRRLDGIPLAIELAAARVRMMTAEQVAARLDNAFRLLTNGNHTGLPRQQTLKAAIDWSYDLLTPKERALFQRLSVFSGGWTIEAAEAVCADDSEPRGSGNHPINTGEVLDLLGQLVDKSLVMVEAREYETRYRLLETIRQYARDQLQETDGDGKSARNRHLAYYALLSGEADQHLRGKGQLIWLSRLEDELDNLRSAMEWSQVGKIETGLQIAADLMWFWIIRGLFQEGMEWLKLLLASEAQGRADLGLTGEQAIQRARALRAFSLQMLYIDLFSYGKRIAAIQESIALLRCAGASSHSELGISILFLLMFENSLSDPSPNREEMLAIFHQGQQRFYLSVYYSILNGESFQHEDLDKAEAFTEASLAIREEIKDIDGIASNKYTLGYYALLAGKYQKAETLFQQAIDLCQKVKKRWFEAEIKTYILWIEMARGNYAEVTRLGAEALSRLRELKYFNGIYPFIFNLLRSAWSQGDFPQVITLAREITEKFADSAECLQDAYFYLGRTALTQSNLSEAETLFNKAVSLGTNFNVTEREYLLLGWASLYIKQGSAGAAARLLGALDKLYQRTYLSLSPRERSEHDEALANARSALGEVEFDLAWDEGEGLTLTQGMEFVLGGIVLDNYHDIRPDIRKI